MTNRIDRVNTPGDIWARFNPDTMALKYNKKTNTWVVSTLNKLELKLRSVFNYKKPSSEELDEMVVQFSHDAKLFGKRDTDFTQLEGSAQKIYDYLKQSYRHQTTLNKLITEGDTYKLSKIEDRLGMG